MTTRLINFAIVLLALSGPLTLTGCQIGSGHEKNVTAAADRWKALRASMILPMAQKQFDTGDLDQAEQTLLEALSVDDKNPHLYVLAGRVAMERGQLERGHQRLQTAIDLAPELGEAYYFQGIVLQRWSQFDRALQRYEKAYELSPDNPAFLIAIGEMLVAQDRTDEALARLSAKLEYFDENAGMRMAVGQMLMMQQQPTEAIVHLQQASMLSPDDLQIVEELAKAQLAGGQADLASVNYERLCSETSVIERPDIRQGLAQCYLAEGRLADAKAIYLKLTRHHAKDPNIWVRLGEISWMTDDTAGALLAANRAMSLEPKRHEGYLLAGMVWHRRGRLDRALTMFDHAAERAPKSAMPMILRGITLEQAERSAEAAAAYAEALRRQPTDPHAQRLLAQVEGGSGQP